MLKILIIPRLTILYRSKYLVPRFSNSMKEIADYFNLKANKRHKSQIRRHGDHNESLASLVSIIVSNNHRHLLIKWVEKSRAILHTMMKTVEG